MDGSEAIVRAHLVNEYVIPVQDVGERVFGGVDFVKSVVVNVGDDHVIVGNPVESRQSLTNTWANDEGS